MGIFNRKSKREQKEEKRQRSVVNHWNQYSLDGENEILLYGVSDKGQVTHRNGEKTRLKMARIIKNRIGDAVFGDEASYIAFELPEDVELSEDIIHMVMTQFDQESMMKNERSYYLGRLVQDQRMYGFGNKSVAIETSVRKIVAETDRERAEQIKRNNEENARLEASRAEEFRKKARADAEAYNEEMMRERAARKAEPYLRNTGPLNAKGNYDGINLKTGDILRLRAVQKVGKDGSGTYLYSTYVNSTFNEYDAEMFYDGEPAGVPVCFTLDKRLEDIVKEGNIEEIRAVLTLLSSVENFQNRGELAYIGGINRNNHILMPNIVDGQLLDMGRTDNYGQSGYNQGKLTGEYFPSTAIGMKIKAMQEEYARRYQEKQEQIKREQGKRGE